MTRLNQQAQQWLIGQKIKAVGEDGIIELSSGETVWLDEETMAEFNDKFETKPAETPAQTRHQE